MLASFWWICDTACRSASARAHPAGQQESQQQLCAPPATQAQLSLGGTPRPQRRSNAALAHAHGSRKASAADEFADFVTELRRGIAHGVRATTRCWLLFRGAIVMNMHAGGRSKSARRIV